MDSSVPVAVAAELSSGGGGTPVASVAMEAGAAAEGGVLIEVHDGGHEVTVTQTGNEVEIRVLNANTGDRFGCIILSEDLAAQESKGTKHEVRN